MEVDFWIRLFFTAMALLIVPALIFLYGNPDRLNKPYQAALVAFIALCVASLIISLVGIIWTA